MHGRAAKHEVEMVRDTIDIERCVWDMDYRSKVKQVLNFCVDLALPSANQNVKSRNIRVEQPSHGTPE